MFRIWVEPAVAERGLGLSRSEIVQALVVLAPSDTPRVSINDEVELIASVRAARPIEAGQVVTLGDISGVQDLRPANIDGNAGWLALAKIGNEVTIAFDFRRNRQTAALLVSRALEFTEAATISLGKGHLGPAIENGFAAVELAVKAQMFLLQDNPTKVHRERVTWWSQWEKLGNAPPGASQVLQQLYGERGASRYGDRPISMAPDDVRAALEGLAGIIDLARARNAERQTPT
ncbi:MAG: HEPN domain-containing protein [Candidatus Dormibacteria bacterium]